MFIASVSTKRVSRFCEIGALCWVAGDVTGALYKMQRHLTAERAILEVSCLLSVKVLCFSHNACLKAPQHCHDYLELVTCTHMYKERTGSALHTSICMSCKTVRMIPGGHARSYLDAIILSVLAFFAAGSQSQRQGQLSSSLDAHSPRLTYHVRACLPELPLERCNQ